MRLVKNEPKVVEVALSKRNLVYLLAAMSLNEFNASTSTLDQGSGYLVKVSIDDEAGKRYTSGAVPAPLQAAIDRIEACLGDSTTDTG